MNTTLGNSFMAHAALSAFSSVSKRPTNSPASRRPGLAHIGILPNAPASIVAERRADSRSRAGTKKEIAAMLLVKARIAMQGPYSLA
jgi:hypothetical protein